jgi:hypothetical protein
MPSLGMIHMFGEGIPNDLQIGQGQRDIPGWPGFFVQPLLMLIDLIANFDDLVLQSLDMPLEALDLVLMESHRLLRGGFIRQFGGHLVTFPCPKGWFRPF